MLTCQWLQTHFPIKKLFCKLENSIQIYINYCKTHAMVTHYSGIGDTSMENPETQDMDNDTKDNFQGQKYYSTINSQNGTIKANHRR